MRTAIFIWTWGACLLLSTSTRADELPGTPAAIVQAWIAASEARPAVSIKGRLLTYDKVFQTYSVGRFRVDATNSQRWRYNYWADPNLVRVENTTRGGIHHTIQASKPGSFECKDERLRIQVGDHVWESPVLKLVAPVSHFFNLNPWDPSPLSWLVFPHEFREELESNSVEFMSPPAFGSDSECLIGLSFTPSPQRRFRTFQRVDLILDCTTMQPVAAQTIDASDSRITTWIAESFRRREQPVGHKIETTHPHTHKAFPLPSPLAGEGGRQAG